MFDVECVLNFRESFFDGLHMAFSEPIGLRVVRGNKTVFNATGGVEMFEGFVEEFATIVRLKDARKAYKAEEMEKINGYFISSFSAHGKWDCEFGGNISVDKDVHGAPF
eukprot:Nk52_evm3s2350 gene=Nk52_evmTU3s2350